MAAATALAVTLGPLVGTSGAQASTAFFDGTSVEGSVAALGPLTVVDQVGWLSAELVDGQVRLGVLSSGYDRTGEVWVPAEEALLRLPAAAATTVPVDSEAEAGGPSFYDFLGQEGDPLWSTALDEADAEASGNLLLGTVTSPSVNAGNKGLGLSLEAVTGPGGAAAYEDYRIGEDLVRNVYWDSGRIDAGQGSTGGEVVTYDNAPPFDRFPMTVSFPAAGVYCLTVSSAVYDYESDPTGVSAGVPAAFAVAVGDVDTTSVPACEQPDPTDPTDPTPGGPLTVVDELGWLSAREEDGEMRFGVVKSSYGRTDEQWVPAEQALVHVPEAALTTIPVDIDDRNPGRPPFYAFMGDTDDPIYTTPTDEAQAQAAGLPVLGVGSSPQEPASLMMTTLRLDGVDGPGAVYAYADQYVPGEIYDRAVYWDPDRQDGLVSSLDLSRAEAPLDRLPSFFSFPAAGVYCVQVTPEVYDFNIDQTSTTSGVSATLAVAVGEVDLAAVPACEQPDPNIDPEPDPEPDPDAPMVFSAGMHVDVSARLGAQGPLELGLRKSDAAGGGNVSWHAFDDGIISLPDSAIRTIPAGEEFAFLGPAGSQVWRSPLIRADNRNAVWMGLGGEEIRGAINEQVRLISTGVAGPGGTPAPGEMVVWQSGAPSGEPPLFSTRQGLPNVTSLPARSHRHANWDFSAPGVYCVGMALSGERADGQVLRDAQTLTVVVGSDIDPATVTPCGRAGDPPPVGTHTFPAQRAPAGQVAELSMSTSDITVPRGHARLATSLAGGTLETRLVVGEQAGPGRSYDLDDLVLRLGQEGEPGRWTIENANDSPQGLGMTEDTLGVPVDAVDGEVQLTVAGYEGPDGFQAGAAGAFGGLRLDTTTGDLTDVLLTEGAADPQWTLTGAGVHCVSLRWSARLVSGEEVSHERTVTLVAGDFPQTVQPCSQGQDPTDPDDPTDPTDPTPREVLDVGHVDLFGRITIDTADAGADAAGGEVELVVKDGRGDAITPVFRELDEVVFHVGTRARRAVPASGYDFLGEQGASTWILPQTEDPALLWPGWDGQPVTGVESFSMSLDEVRGPGQVSVYQLDEVGAPVQLLGSAAGAPTSFEYAEHGHGNWAFSAPGTYCLDLRLATSPTGADAPAPDTETLLVTVGDTDPATATEADCSTDPTDPTNPTDPTDPTDPSAGSVTPVVRGSGPPAPGGSSAPAGSAAVDPGLKGTLAYTGAGVAGALAAGCLALLLGGLLLRLGRRPDPAEGSNP